MSRIIFVILGVIGFLFTLDGHAQGKPKSKEANSSQLSVSVLTKSDKATESERKIALRVPPKPSKLPNAVRKKAIDDIRMAAGYKKESRKTEPPAEILLSPLNPISGKSWYNMTRGWNYPAGAGNNREPFSAIAGRTQIDTVDAFDSYFLFFFETVPKKSYMLDCAVSSNNKNARWILGGAFSGAVTAQRGHLIVGFVAEDDLTNLTMSIESSLVGYMYSCELTRVN